MVQTSHSQPPEMYKTLENNGQFLQDYFHDSMTVLYYFFILELNYPQLLKTTEVLLHQIQVVFKERDSHKKRLHNPYNKYLTQ